MTNDLRKLLEKNRDLYDAGIFSDPILVAIQELIEEAEDQAYEDGYTEAWHDRGQV